MKKSLIFYIFIFKINISLFGAISQYDYSLFTGWWKVFENNNGTEGELLYQANNQIPNNSLAQYMNVLFNNEEITMRPWLDQLSNSSNTTYYGHDIIYQERADMQNSNVSLNFSIKEFSLNPSSYKLVAYFNVMDTQNNWNQVQYEEVIVTSSGNYSLSINTLPQENNRYVYQFGFELRGPWLQNVSSNGSRAVIDDYTLTINGSQNNDTPSENATFTSGENYLIENVNYYSNNFTFGKNNNNNESITWYQEYVDNPYNNEIQDYRRSKVGLDSNNNLILRIDRVGANLFHSSRVNSTPTDGIKVSDGEKLSIEFKAMLPEAKDSLGNYVPNVPLWPALWIMGNDQKNGSWIGWPFCSEIDAMEWSPTRGVTQQNVAYHWNTNDEDANNYNHRYDSFYSNDANLTNNFHTWRVDIYRYHPDQNETNKIEIFYDDQYVSSSRFFEDENKDNSEFWYPVTNQNPEQRSTDDKSYFLIMNIALGGDYPGTSFVPSNFDHAEMVIDDVSYEITSIYDDGSSNSGGGLGGLGGGGGSSTIEEIYEPAFNGVFGGLSYSSLNNSYLFPSSAESWAGVANNNSSIYPLSFPDGGSIKFTGSTSQGNVDIRFKFERLSYDAQGNGAADTEPSFYTNTVTINTINPTEYTVDIPPQNQNSTYRSLLLYLMDQNKSVILTDFEVIKSVSVPNYVLNLNFNSERLNVSKNPDLSSYPSGSEVLVNASPNVGYLLSDQSWQSKLITLNSNQYFSIDTIQDSNDNDQDGLSNYLEAIILGSDLNKSDSDDDNRSDYFEYVSGTDANNPNSYFTSSFSNVDNTSTISYFSQENRNYTISYSNDLNNWTDLESHLGNGSFKAHSFDMNSISNELIQNYFFRINIEMNE